jgi:beta-glucosidase
VQAVAEANPRTVVVLSNGSVVAVSPWQDQVPALVEGWLMGQAGGAAIVDLLLGEADPSGRLAETLPVRLEDNPTIGMFPGEGGHVRYGEGLLIGYRWRDAHRMPVAYPFGHGLSYTAFEHDGLAVEVVEDGADPHVRVRFQVRNAGARAGTETVQVYVRHHDAPVYRPEQELRGSARVRLDPGEAASIEIELDARAFAYWDTTGQRWHVAPGDYEVRVGASSRDIQLRKTVTLAGVATPRPVTGTRTLPRG